MGFTLRGEPYRNLDESLARIEAVTLDEVTAACEKYYEPGEQFILSLGPA